MKEQVHYLKLQILTVSTGVLLRSVVPPSSTYLFTAGVEVHFLFSLDHIQTHTTFGRTPLDE
jgi:hypothetical protein